MPKSLRLNKKEESDAYNKCVELNKKLINRNQMPIREADLLHFILEKSLPNVRVNDSGELYIDI